MIATEEKTIQIRLLENDIPEHLKQGLLSRLSELGIEVHLINRELEKNSQNFNVLFFSEALKQKISTIEAFIEAIIQQIRFDFDALPLLVEGESKIIRLLTHQIVIEQFKPTVYSFTHNRYGIAAKTDDLRIKFSAEVFRQMNTYAALHQKKMKNAFLACVEQNGTIYLVQQKMKTTNLEVRVKRFHVGSPVHRYLYTEKYQTVQNNREPLQKWSRFNHPVVCFDWRHPLTDENGTRLADEPISDDYAAIWMNNIPAAKKLASEVFTWLEAVFKSVGLILVDICFFIDEDGEYVFGEISPDCFRVRESLDDNAKSFDKDVWRKGGSAEKIAERYEILYNLIFNKN